MSALDNVKNFIAEALDSRFETIDASSVADGFYVPMPGSGLKIEITLVEDEHLLAFAQEMDIPAEVQVTINFFICKGIQRSAGFFEYFALELPALTDHLAWLFEEDGADTLGLALYKAFPGDTLNEYQFLLTVEGMLSDGFKVASSLIEYFDAEWIYDMNEEDD